MRIWGKSSTWEINSLPPSVKPGEARSRRAWDGTSGGWALSGGAVGSHGWVVSRKGCGRIWSFESSLWLSESDGLGVGWEAMSLGVGIPGRKEAVGTGLREGRMERRNSQQTHLGAWVNRSWEHVGIRKRGCLWAASSWPNNHQVFFRRFWPVASA